MADKIYIDNDKLSLFHGFSKTPVSSKIALGNAINKSGHTVQSSEIWSDEIPYFGKFGTTQVAHDTVSKDTVYGDMLYIGGNSYYKRNKVEYAEGKTFNDLWTNVTADFKDGYVFENRHGKGVIVYHQNQYLQNLNDDNNANTNSENCAARLWVYETKEGETKKVARLVEQFVGPTDKALNGLASVSYSPVVNPVGGEAYEEGTQYSLVGFSGTVLWSEDRANTVTVQSDGSVTSQFQISCFEYIGDKLSASISDIQGDISELDDKLSKISVTASGGVQALSDAAKSAGFEIDSVVADGITTPTLDIQTGTVATGVTKLVTGDAVKTYVDTTALADGGSIAQKITSSINALGDVAVKSDIKISEIKVKSGSTTTTLTPDSNKSVTVEIPEVQAATTSVAGVVTISDNDAIATTETSTAAATVAAVAATRSAIAGELGALAITVSSNKTEVDGKISAIEGKLASTGEIGQAIAGVKATADSAVQSVTRATGSSTLLTVTDGTDVTISLSTEVATKSDAATAAANAVTTGLATGGNIAQAIAAAKSGAEQTAATALSTARGEITTEISTAVSGLKTELTTGDGSLGAKVAALETATGTTLPAAIEQALTDAKAYSDSLHTTSLDYVVLGDSESLPTASADTLGKIYLVASQNAPTADGSAISGSYVEYMTRKVSETEYTWEKIGTTAADLSAYAKTADVTTAIATAKSEAIAAAKTETTTQVNALAATHATDKAALEASIATKVGEVQWFGENDLLSTKAEVKDGKLVVSEKEITPIREWAMKRNITKVTNEVAYAGDTKYCTIETSKMTSGAEMFYGSSLSEFSSDLSSLTNGTSMFWGTANMKTFVNDMPSLTDCYYMFGGSALTTFVGDLSSLTNGYHMFTGSALTTFVGDLSSLTNGNYMFHQTNITSFDADLSSLTDGKGMFYSSKLSEFTSDLPALKNGVEMFNNTYLTVDSVANIADTIRQAQEISSNEGKITISWNDISLYDTETRKAFVRQLARIADKGWYIMTNVEFLPIVTELFGDEYFVGSDSFEAATLEIDPETGEAPEPQIIHFIVKK